MNKVPHTCPVCVGKRKVGAGFYGPSGSSSADEMCRSCQGTGVVWEPKQ